MHRKLYYLIPAFLLLAGSLYSFEQPRDFPDASDQENAPKRKQPGWFDMSPNKPSAADQLAYASELREQGRQRKAIRESNRLVLFWPHAEEAPAAQYMQALILEERGKLHAAFREFQYLVDFYAGKFDYNNVLEHQLQLANTVRTTKTGAFLFFSGFSSPERSIELYEQIVKNAPAWPRAPEAQFNIGLVHEELNDFDEAVLAYDTLLHRYPDSVQASDGSFHRAICVYRMAVKYPRDERRTMDAMVALSGFVAAHPRHPQAESARQYREDLLLGLGEKYFDQAVFYDKIARKPSAAIIAYRDFVRRFPSSSRVQEAQSRIEELKTETERNKK
jgi:tetratricopeptide (TPR) repeat protein